MNPRANVMLTRGNAPASLWVGATEFKRSPPRVTVADTVGAGDASIGGFLFSLIDAPQRSWPEHLAFALAAGAAACRQPGAHAPSRQEVEELLGAG
jgi:fructokinase